MWSLISVLSVNLISSHPLQNLGPCSSPESSFKMVASLLSSPAVLFLVTICHPAMPFSFPSSVLPVHWREAHDVILHHPFWACFWILKWEDVIPKGGSWQLPAWGFSWWDTWLPQCNRRTFSGFTQPAQSPLLITNRSFCKANLESNFRRTHYGLGRAREETQAPTNKWQLVGDTVELMLGRNQFWVS